MLNKAFLDEMDISRSINIRNIRKSSVVAEKDEKCLENRKYEGNLRSELFEAYKT